MTDDLKSAASAETSVRTVTTVCQWIGGALFVVALLLLLLYVGSMDYSFALIDEAIEKEARPARAAQAQEEVPALSHPLGCSDQWIARRADGKAWRVDCVHAVRM